MFWNSRWRGFVVESPLSHVLRIKDQPACERPRERLAAKGPGALTDAELIAILLCIGPRGANAVEIGSQLLRKFASVQGPARFRL